MSGTQHEANMRTVEVTSNSPPKAKRKGLLKKGEILRASSVQKMAVATMDQSNKSRTLNPAMPPNAAGKLVNEPTKTISIHAR